MLCARVARAAGAMWLAAYSCSRSRKSAFSASSALRARARGRRGTRSCPAAGWRAAARAGRRSRPCRRRRSCGPCLIFLSSMSCSTRSMMSPICSMLIVNETMSVQRRPSSSSSASPRDLRQVELDRRVELVDDVVELAQLARRARGRCCGAPAAMPRSIVSTTSAWCSASRAAQRDRERRRRRAPSGSRWRGRVVPASGRARGSRRSTVRADQAGEADEQQRERDVEAEVEQHDLLRAPSATSCCSSTCDLRQQRRRRAAQPISLKIRLPSGSAAHLRRRRSGGEHRRAGRCRGWRRAPGRAPRCSGDHAGDASVAISSTIARLEYAQHVSTRADQHVEQHVARSATTKISRAPPATRSAAGSRRRSAAARA